MKIRHRLTLQFTLLAGIIQLVVFVLVYLLFVESVNNAFYRRLEDRALITAQVYLEKDELEKKNFLEIQQKYQQVIPGENSNLYDENDHPLIAEKPGYSWPPIILSAIRHLKQYRFHYQGQPAVGLYYADNQGNFVIVVTAADIAGHMQLIHLVWILAGTFVLGMGMLFLIGQWNAYRALLPVNIINQEVQNIRATNLHLRVNKGRNEDEVAELATNFNELLEHLEKAFALQQSFVSNASHELRTPLTAMITEMEVILQKERASEDYINTLRSVLDEAAKLETITNGLLELTRADGLEYAGRQRVRIDELLWDLWEEWHTRYPDQLLDVQLLHMPNDARFLEVAGSRELLEMAIRNLLKNAFKFSNDKPVQCRLECRDNTLLLQVIDQGIGIAPEDLERIFLPLFRANNARLFPGFGIGLAMVQKIIQAHRGQLTVQSTPGKGSTFNVSFTASGQF
jgi:signal transduction histidine kinase